LRSIKVRCFRFFGFYPIVRLIQVLDNPAYLLHILKKNLVYKRDRTDYRPYYEKFTFLSGQQTLEELIRSGKSLARYSDGEFEQITGAGEYPPDSDWCQKWSPELKQDILCSLACTDPRLLVAVDPPETFLAPRDAVRPIEFYYNMWVDMRRLMWRYLSTTVPYGHCHLFIKANCPDLHWPMMRDHFATKDIIIATGNTHKLKHLNLGRPPFFIECGTENAYERKETIKQDIRDLIEREKLDKSQTIVCASLGPTAGILAWQLLDEQIWVWDTGHMFEFAAKNFIESVFDRTSVAA